MCHASLGSIAAIMPPIHCARAGGCGWDIMVVVLYPGLFTVRVIQGCCWAYGFRYNYRVYVFYIYIHEPWLYPWPFRPKPPLDLGLGSPTI